VGGGRVFLAGGKKGRPPGKKIRGRGFVLEFCTHGRVAVFGGGELFSDRRESRNHGNGNGGCTNRPGGGGERKKALGRRGKTLFNPGVWPRTGVCAPES